MKSAATGRMNRDSDVDLLVLEREVADARKDIIRIRAALAGLPFPFDVVVMSRDRFEETRNVIGGIAWAAARYGRIIYEAPERTRQGLITLKPFACDRTPSHALYYKHDDKEDYPE